MVNNFEPTWFNERIKDVPINKKLYRFMCFFLGARKNGLTYKQMYLIIEYLNRKKYSFEESKKQAMKEILNIYQYNNNITLNVE